MAGSAAKQAKPKAKAAKAPAKHAHQRTAERERVVVAMSKAPGVTHGMIAEALGIAPKTLYAHYSDLINHPGPGGPAHLPTDVTRVLVANYKATGLTNDEIAALMKLSRDTLEKHYPEELARGVAIVTGKIGNRVIVRALGNGPEAQRASEFYLNGWKNRVQLDTARQEAQEAEAGPTLVGPQLTRDHARRVAFMLQKAAQQKLANAKPVDVVSDAPAPAEPSGGV